MHPIVQGFLNLFLITQGYTAGSAPAVTVSVIVGGDGIMGDEEEESQGSVIE